MNNDNLVKIIEDQDQKIDFYKKKVQQWKRDYEALMNEFNNQADLWKRRFEIIYNHFEKHKHSIQDN